MVSPTSSPSYLQIQEELQRLSDNPLVQGEISLALEHLKTVASYGMPTARWNEEVASVKERICHFVARNGPMTYEQCRARLHSTPSSTKALRILAVGLGAASGALSGTLISKLTADLALQKQAALNTAGTDLLQATREHQKALHVYTEALGRAQTTERLAIGAEDLLSKASRGEDKAYLISKRNKALQLFNEAHRQASDASSAFIASGEKAGKAYSKYTKAYTQAVRAEVISKCLPKSIAATAMATAVAYAVNKATEGAE